MINYRPGELDQRINIKREILVDDVMGGQEVTLTNIATCISAHSRNLSGKESERYDRLNATSLNMFVVRYRDDLREDDRIEWGSVEYNIRHIPNNGSRKNYTEIIAERGVAQ